MPDDPTQQDLKNALEVLYDQLTNAYWVATTIEDKDRLRGLADSVSDILDEMDIADIKSGTAKFKALSQTITSLNERLDKLKQDIDKIIHVVKVATNVTKAADKVVTQAAKFFV